VRTAPTVLRLATAAVSAVIALTAPSIAPAAVPESPADVTRGAQSGPAVPAPNSGLAPSSTATSAPKIAEEAIDYYIEEHGVDRDEARRRLAVQVRRPRLQDELRDRLGDDIAQLRFDDEFGGFVLGVAPGGDPGQAQRAFADLGFAPGEFRVRRERFSSADLLEAHAEARRALETELAEGEVSVSIGAGRVQVYVDDALAPAERDAVDRRSRAATSPRGVGVAVRAVSDPAPAAAQCARPYCDPVVAGVEWSRGCSLAFYSGSPPGNGHFFLTAGHCIDQWAPPNSQWSTCRPGGWPCDVGGQVIGGYYNGGDAGVVRVDQFGFGLFPGWVNWWNGGITRLTHWANPVVDYVLCHNGRVAGSSCGTVADTNWSFNQGGVSLWGMTRVDGSCVRPGDSGGPWTYADYTYAAGITNGGLCNDERGQGLVASVEPIGRALSTLNLVVYG